MIIKYLIIKKEVPMKQNKKNITINQITISILETIWAVGITVASNGVHNICLKINN